MVCEHLSNLEEAMLKEGVKETYRGQAWTDDCREWVYFDVVLDIESLSRRFNFPACVTVHENLDPKSGQERGFFCEICKDGIMGLISGEETFR
jgi:hypothetical protein